MNDNASLLCCISKNALSDVLRNRRDEGVFGVFAERREVGEGNFAVTLGPDAGLVEFKALVDNAVADA